MKRIIKFLLPLVTVPTILVYLVSCFTPYIPPYNFWPLTFLTIGFPIIALAVLSLLFTWFFINKKICLVVFILFFAGYKNLGSTFAFSVPTAFNYIKDSSHLRVMSWNVKFFENASKHADSPTAERRKMINYIKKANPDVLLLQEYREVANPAIFSNLEVLRDTLGFKYFYVNNDLITEWSYGTSYEGCAIFSKYPLADTGKIVYPNLISGESVAYADVVINDEKVRFFSTHLLSMSLFNSEEVKREGIFINRQRLVKNGRSRISLLKRYDSIHSRQAELFANVIARSPYPVIAAGDFNSVPTSYVYHTIKGKLHDAFLRKGFGFGQTYIALSPTLRIDYILVEPGFKVIQATTPSYSASDHFPVVADINIR